MTEDERLSKELCGPMPVFGVEALCDYRSAVAEARRDLGLGPIPPHLRYEWARTKLPDNVSKALGSHFRGDDEPLNKFYPGWNGPRKRKRAVIKPLGRDRP